MKTFRIFTLLLFLPLLACTQPATEEAFSPSQEAVELIERTISHAEHSIDVAAYSFTSKKIAYALINAHKRGVEVRVVLDKGQSSRHCHAIEEMQDAGIPIRINSHYAIMHDKYMVIDDSTVETGSFNYTVSAEKRNAENVIVIHDDPKAVAAYTQQWKKLWAEAK